MPSANKYTVHLPMKGWTSAVKAANHEMIGANDASTVPAGEYYIQREMGNILLISDREEGGVAYWINKTENDENGMKNTTTLEEDDSADPSNTNSLSGYYQQNQNTLTKKHVSEPETVAHTCYIKNLVTGTTLELHLPDALSDSYSAQFDAIDIRGRSNQIQGYSSSSSREISWTAHVFEDYAEYGVIGTVSILKAMVYPNYSGYVEPPVCYIRIGNAVRGKFILTSVSVDYQVPYRDDMYIYAEVSLSATEAGDVVYSAADIEAGKGMRSE